MAGRIKVTGRFFVIIALVAAVTAFAIYMTREEPVREVAVEAGSIGKTQEMNAVIMRDETVVSSESYARLDFIAEECQLVSAGDAVASVYTAGYSEKEMDNLEATRKEIRDYYSQILENILDDSLEQYNESVGLYARELQTLIQGNEQGNLLNVQAQLEQAMTDRQDYLRMSKREEIQLSNLYQKETQLMNSIASWKSDLTAPCPGIVSFYLDGYESLLTPDNYEQLTLSDIKGVIRGDAPSITNQTRTTTPLFKVIDSGSWSVLIISSDNSYLPTLGQTYTLTLSGFEDYIYEATVSNYQRFDGETLIRMDIDQDVLPMINMRATKASVGTQYSGLKVPLSAISNVNGTTGVYTRSGAGEGYDFIQVQVTASDADYAIITPVIEGSVYAGMNVVIK